MVGFQFQSHQKTFDAELRGIDLIDHVVDEERAKHIIAEWDEFWPQSGNSMNWDAVGVLYGKDHARQVLLLEAKANALEMISTCGAKDEHSRTRIAEALQKTKSILKVNNNNGWMENYYQYANRLTVQVFLAERNISAKLVYLYFYKDAVPGSARHCPASVEEWLPCLTVKNDYLGVAAEELEKRSFDVFLPVAGA